MTMSGVATGGLGSIGDQQHKPDDFQALLETYGTASAAGDYKHFSEAVGDRLVEAGVLDENSPWLTTFVLQAQAAAKLREVVDGRGEVVRDFGGLAMFLSDRAMIGGDEGRRLLLEYADFRQAFAKACRDELEARSGQPGYEAPDDAA